VALLLPRFVVDAALGCARFCYVAVMTPTRTARLPRAAAPVRLLQHTVAVIALMLVVATLAAGQPRSMAQDPALNNLRHAEGVATMPAESLGRVRQAGTGPRNMVLLPGLGFGDGIWSEFMDRHQAVYTMYAVTLPGFGGTAPLALPPEGSRYADRPWTKSAINAVRRLIEEKRLERVTIVAHWALATQIALQLAFDLPNRIDAVILVGGPLKSHYESPPGMLTWTAAQRAAYADGVSQKWFKTVTRQTWDDNNFMSYDYSLHPRRGLFLWREAQAPALPVWIHYLLEFYTMDQSSLLAHLRVPTLVVQPGFDDPGFQPEPGWNYMRTLCHDSWKGVVGGCSSCSINPTGWIGRSARSCRAKNSRQCLLCGGGRFVLLGPQHPDTELGLEVLDDQLLHLLGVSRALHEGGCGDDAAPDAGGNHGEVFLWRGV
jgi:pimeloyl-ACP methyl ester carboxylesterase